MELQNLIEAILFVSGSGVSIKELERLTASKKDEIEAALANLKNDLSSRGIRLLEFENEFTLTTAPEASHICERIVKEHLEGDLTKAALETLSIILWKGKISRSSIDFLRGVNSAFSLRSLLIRGLVKREPDPKDARIYLYLPTLDLLKYLGVESLLKLPQFDEIKNRLKEYD